MLKYGSVFVLILATASGCVYNFKSGETVGSGSSQDVSNTSHNSRNSLDWNGVYKGVVPCEICSGTNLLIELKTGGQYSLSRSYIDQMSATVMEEGEINWNSMGNTIQVGVYRFVVEENKLVLIDQDESRLIDGEGNPYILTKEIW